MPKEKFLTNRQKKFCELIMEGIYSNSECARQSGYSHGQANKHASLLLNGRDFPLVTEHLKELREIREKKYGVTLMGQLKRLSDLSRGAEEVGQFSSAINSEKIRSALGGLTTDNRQNTVIHQLDSLSREEIIARLSEIRKKHPSAFIDGDYKVVGNDKGEENIISDLGKNISS
tara:strand:+ start:1310 stop:1831 length:522 start_codon:yes stop_codon:yes gene_type:complete